MEMRDPELRGLKIKMVYIRWIFRQCAVCHLEFRKTAMWTWLSNEYTYDMDRIRRYACQSCVPSYDKLMGYLKPEQDTGDLIPGKPNRPEGHYLKG